MRTFVLATATLIVFAFAGTPRLVAAPAAGTAVSQASGELALQQNVYRRWYRYHRCYRRWC
jgi:hypothetical protein